MSPDSDFPISHLPLVRLAGVTNVPLAEIEKIAAGILPVPEDGDLNYAIGLSAAYAPRGINRPGEFEWLYDAQGIFREEVWRRWLANDPLTIVRKNPRAFAAGQVIYLEKARRRTNSRRTLERGKSMKCCECARQRVTFYEPPGHITADHINERLWRGLEWVFNRPPHQRPFDMESRIIFYRASGDDFGLQL